jgi:ssDNA thymidine ADP-ribosyltransferase DarT-like protein
MLYAICQGAVEGYAAGQEEVLHLVSSTEKIVEERLRFTYTEGHAVMAPSEFFDDLGHLARIDWPLMESRYWFDTDEDPDRKRRRQAEFLVHRFAPLSCFLEIGVMTEPVARRVTEILGRGSALRVKVRRNWYY